MLGQKKKVTNEQWQTLFENIGSVVSKREIDNVIDEAVEELKSVTCGKSAGYGWSAGKDSIALEFLCRQAGIMRGVWGKTNLEYPEFEQWCFKNKPDGVRIINTGLDMLWIVRNPQMLFPATRPIDDKWMPVTYWKAQQQYFDEERLDVLILGRRLKDGNFCGKNKFHISKSKTTYNPMAYWSHEHILALIHYYNLELPPIYKWREGWVYGTHEWARRNLKGKSIHEQWGIIYEIDPSIVHKAAPYIVSAFHYLTTK